MQEWIDEEGPAQPRPLQGSISPRAPQKILQDLQTVASDQLPSHYQGTLSPTCTRVEGTGALQPVAPDQKLTGALLFKQRRKRLAHAFGIRTRTKFSSDYGSDGRASAGSRELIIGVDEMGSVAASASTSVSPSPEGRKKLSRMSSTFVHLDEDSEKAQQAAKVGCLLPAMPCRTEVSPRLPVARYPASASTKIRESRQHPAEGSSVLPILACTMSTMPELSKTMSTRNGAPGLPDAGTPVSSGGIGLGPVTILPSFKRTADRPTVLSPWHETMQSFKKPRKVESRCRTTEVKNRAARPVSAQQVVLPGQMVINGELREPKKQPPVLRRTFRGSISQVPPTVGGENAWRRSSTRRLESSDSICFI
eukprot:gnl/MRDRNA2_/MRDRNA2_163967_c0_seq1.p1 gnl/MRDRNA2_/MRDRNA2_163967_c0~~gnl/MRDRNA2_/MRDRNA2_163967_c0_seq1.p1  ORF type:complete len:365 (+),score=51.68 gnl/MRDRNA2_/MRDRNA2_163967_c0_seq1:35-1129(+)